MVSRLWIAAAAAVTAGIAGASPAAAQRVWQDGRWVSMPPRAAPTVMATSPHRWETINGRWRGGWEAPGGWNAYRRLGRGATLPGYWMQHRVPDYLNYGLAAPPRGYFWVRYYDDAVLVDEDGRVWDSIGGIAWAGASAGGSYSHSYSHARVQAGAGYAPPRPVDPDDYYGPPEPPIDPDDYYGPAEPPIAPEYPDYDPRPAPEPYGAPYPPPAPAPHVVQIPPPCARECRGGHHGGYYKGGSSYYAGGYGYGYAAGGTTTVVITIPAPVTTTTTTTTTTTSWVETKSTRRHAPTKRLWRKTVRR